MEALIYSPVTLTAFLQYLLQHSVPSDSVEPGSAVSQDPTIRIIACCTREAFQTHLLHSILEATRDICTQPPDVPPRCTGQVAVPNQSLEKDSDDVATNKPNAPGATDEQHSARPRPSATDHPLLKQNLRTLFASAVIKMTFCDSAPVLYAYLTTLAVPSSGLPAETAQEGPKRQLILLNPVAMHRDSTSYSAQGISRTLAAAFEAAWRTDRALVVVETLDTAPASMASANLENDADVEQLETDVETGTGGAAEDQQSARGLRQSSESRQTVKLTDPWDAEIPIVNPTTKSFGSAVERAKMARKTTIRAVAATWFRFQSLP